MVALVGHWELVPPKFRDLSSERTAASTTGKVSYHIVAALSFPARTATMMRCLICQASSISFVMQEGRKGANKTKQNKTKLVNCLGLYFLGFLVFLLQL